MGFRCSGTPTFYPSGFRAGFLFRRQNSRFYFTIFDLFFSRGRGYNTAMVREMTNERKAQAMLRLLGILSLGDLLFGGHRRRALRYCYNERERAAAVSELGKGCEITRFKGLGEISPHEFGQFVDEGIRLQPVNIDNVKNIDSMLQFFMGDNTPERKDYIMRNCFFDLT